MNAQIDRFKQQAAQAAAEFIESGMVLGLGSGSTASQILAPLAEKLKAGTLKDILGIPCSRETQATAERLGIPLGDLSHQAHIDLTIDGADEVDPALNLIKGGGGALLREKIVAQATHRYIIVVDSGKVTPQLGTRFALPIEVAQFGWGRQAEFLAELGAKAPLRQAGKGEPYVTDGGNYILDAQFGPMADPQGLARRLESRAGILEHGLFLGLATDLIVAGPLGVEHRQAGR